MDPSRDNPIIRFTTFWWGIGIFFIFALLLAVFWLFASDETSTLEDAAAEPRYETKRMIDTQQEASLSPETVEIAMAATAKALATSKPVAVEVPAQVVPGSETSKKLADTPAVDTAAIDAPVESDAPIDPAVMEIGKTAYMLCGACHGQNGEGGPIAPPLANSDWVTGPISNLIRIQLRGLVGPITVNGVEYNFPGGMAPLNYQTDEQIAGVLTYIRNSFGNKASAVTPEQVAALRSEVGKPQVTVEELTQP